MNTRHPFVLGFFLTAMFGLERRVEAQPQLEPTAPERTELLGKTEIEMIEGFQWAVVEVSINGQGPFRMILDSGAGVTVLNEDLVRELALEGQGTTRVGNPAAPEAHEVDRLLLETVSVGDAYFEGVAAVGWRGPSLAAMGGIRGVLGFPTFAECLLTLDYPGRGVEISEGSLPEPDGKQVLPMTLDGAPSIPVRVAGFPFDAHVDTGNMNALVVPASWMERMPVVEGSLQEGSAVRGGSPAEFTLARLDANLEIGSLVLESPRVHFDKALPVVNVGYGVLEDYRVTFDQRNGRLRLARPTSAPSSGTPEVVEPASPTPRRIGVQMAMKNGTGFTVARVLPGSAGEAAGLKTGDELLEVDGEPMTQETLVAALRRTDAVVLTVLRDGRRERVSLFGKQESP